MGDEEKDLKGLTFKINFSGDEELRNAVFIHITRVVNKTVAERFEEIIANRLDTAVERAVMKAVKENQGGLADKMLQSAKSAMGGLMPPIVRDFLLKDAGVANLIEAGIKDRLQKQWAASLEEFIKEHVKRLWKETIVREIQNS